MPSSLAAAARQVSESGAKVVDETSSSSASSASGTEKKEPDSYHSLSYAYKTYLRHDKDEQDHWEDVCQSYRQYATFAMAQWANHQYRLHSLPEEQRKVLPAALRGDTEEFQQRAKLYKEAAIRNQFCLDCILRHAGQPHSQTSAAKNSKKFSSDAQMSKVSSVLKSLVRDWSKDGQVERDLAYKPILEQTKKYIPIPSASANPAGQAALPRICVPGAGVGRLAMEISALGYAVQGNEFSLYMLLASDFILNGGVATPQTPLRISPWLLESRNVHKSSDPFRVVSIPDIDLYELLTKTGNNIDSGSCNEIPADASVTSDGVVSESATTGGSGEESAEKTPTPFSMAAGEFVSIYGTPREKGAWDGVVACFFLDASPSIVEYLQVIHDMLKPGGVLINFGPLHWHWSGPAMRPDDKTVEDYRARYSYLDKNYLSSVDLSWEDIQNIVTNIGFEIVECSSGNRALYTADRSSMVNMDYRCVNFVARKNKAGCKPLPAKCIEAFTEAKSS